MISISYLFESTISTPSEQANGIVVPFGPARMETDPRLSEAQKMVKMDLDEQVEYMKKNKIME